MSPPAVSFSRAERWRSLTVTAVVLLVYILGSCRTIYVGDSGELVAAAATLGIPHPSGYPLYVLLGHLWIELLPFGSIAFRMSLMSAFTAALAVGGLFAIGRRLGLSLMASLTGAGLLAFSPSFWSQANIQRVYALNALFLVAVTALAFEWYRTRQIRYMALAAFLAGLGACNHTAMALHGVAVGLFAILIEPKLLLRVKDLALCVGAGILGLLPYLYLPLRSRQEPRLDWGDPDNLERFLNVVRRKDFWDRAWVESPADWLMVIGDYARGLGEETLWMGLALAVLAFIIAISRSLKSENAEETNSSIDPRLVLLPLFAMAANLWAVGVHGSRSDIFIWHRYYIPSYLMLCFLAALGAEIVHRRWRRGSLVLLAAPIVLFLIGYPKFDRSDFRIAEDFSRTLLDALPPGARLAASDDNILFVLLYLHLAEGVRPDIHLVQQGIGGTELPSLRFDPDEDPLFFTHHPNWKNPALELQPVGLVFRTVRPGKVYEPFVMPPTLQGIDDPSVPKDYLTQNLSGHYHYMLGITYEKRDWKRAQAEFERAQELAFSNDVMFYNLGLIYRRNGLLDRARQAFLDSHAINPRRLASNKPARASDRLAEIEDEIEEQGQIEAALRPDLAGLAPGDVEYHLRLATALHKEGFHRLAHGHRLRALELR